MVFFNFSSMLKAIVYGIKGITKYICCSLLIVSFVVVCLLLFCKKSSAETIESAYTSSDKTAIQNAVDSIIGDYQYFSCTLPFLGSNTNTINVFNISNGAKLYYDSNGHIKSNVVITGKYYSFGSYGVRYGGDFSGIMTNDVGFRGSNPYFYSNLPLYYSNLTDIMWAPDGWQPEQPFISPSFLNYDDTKWSGTLENGEFNYFYIDGNSVDKIYLYLYDKTYGVGDSDWLSWTTLLDSSSPYIYDTTEGSYKWAFLKTVPFGSYLNNHEYSLLLQYQDNNDTWHDLTYNWTTNFSQSVIDNEQSQIAGGINNIDNYLNNDEVNDSDFELPEINVNDFTFSFFSTLVGSITDAFLDTTNDETITFDVRGNTYTIHSTQFNVLGNSGLVVIKNFVALFWVFSIGYWIFCDARKRIMRLKEFNWTAMFADDISVDML